MRQQSRAPISPMAVGRHACTYLHRVDDEGPLAHAGALQDRRQLLQALPQDMVRADVDLGDDEEDGDLERERDAEVLFAHAYHTLHAQHASSAARGQVFLCLTKTKNPRRDTCGSFARDEIKAALACDWGVVVAD